jgi:hypothetical protein
MTITELYKKLVKAYTVDNLNKISLTLINLYKNQQFSALQAISEIISDHVVVEIKDNGKGFSGLMMLYHPDRLNYHIREINELHAQNKYNELLKYSHILQLERIDEIAAMLDNYIDIDYSPVYEWDIDMDDFTIINDLDTVKDNPSRNSGCSFYDAIKIREYGQTNIEFPTYYLEDFEEFEMSSSDIDDLDGVQFCIHAKSLDLSDNRIFDLSYLSDLYLLEELNLSDNKIGYIDALGYLPNLKNIDLSNNKIKDISPLFELENLEYIVLTGNPVKMSQIRILADAGVTVDY